MPVLTEQQARDLADRFAVIARELDDYVLEMSGELHGSEIRMCLIKTATQIRDASVEMSGLANMIAMDDLESCLSRLDAATNDLLKAVRRVSWPDRVLRLATAGLAIAMAVPTCNPSSIYAAVEDAYAAIRENA